MRTLQKTIILTVLGADPSLSDVPELSHNPGVVCGTDRRLADIRRGMIVVRTGDDTRDLHRRLTDSIIRLAGGAAADAGLLAGKILAELRRASWSDTTHRAWTLAHIWDGPRNDPYAPRLSRLRLVDTPTRRRRVGQRLRRSIGRSQEVKLHHTPTLGEACLS
jgi:hypothetical protein